MENRSRTLDCGSTSTSLPTLSLKAEHQWLMEAYLLEGFSILSDLVDFLLIASLSKRERGKHKKRLFRCSKIENPSRKTQSTCLCEPSTTAGSGLPKSLVTSRPSLAV